MSYFTRNMDKCSRLHSFPVTRYISTRTHLHKMYYLESSSTFAAPFAMRRHNSVISWQVRSSEDVLSW